MTSAASSEQLRSALEQDASETEAQIQRLEKVFAALGQSPERVTCEAILGLLQESDEVLKASGDAGPIRDAALIACVQAVEHYEIARYGALAQWAKTMGKSDIVALLEDSLSEEKAADKKLNELAVEEVNKAALEA